MRRGERKGRSIQLVIPEELEQSAMIVVGARLGRDVYLSGLTTELGWVHSRLDFELLDGVYRWLEQVEVEVDVCILDAVESIVIKRRTLAADRHVFIGPRPALPVTALCRAKTGSYVGAQLH